MILWVFSGLLFSAALWLGWLTFQRGRAPFEHALLDSRRQFFTLVPRLVVGFIGSGYIAEVMPREMVLAWFGPGSGTIGYLLAAVAGTLVPGGPVVGFALGAAALKAGAGVPQVMAFVTAWSLYTLNRLLVWEVPTMPPKIVLIRVIVSLPFPFLVAWLAGYVPIGTPSILVSP